MRIAFDKKELEDMANRTKPITPKENFRLLLTGKRPYWIPETSLGPGNNDVRGFRPRICPDNVANHLVFDGEPPYEDYHESNIEMGWFDIPWQYVPEVEGSTVKPGAPKVPDINEWEKYITFPDLDSYDWKTFGEKNKDYLNTNRMTQLCVFPGGPWERLMSMLDVENACVALIDEEQKDSVKRFLDKYADFVIDYIRRVIEVCNIDSVLLHDDWGHQNGPFFSLDTAMEMLVPYLKRIIDYVHSQKMLFELHSCGKNESLVPAYIAMGVDIWCPQPINDYEMLVEKYKDAPIVFSLEVAAWSGAIRVPNQLEVSDNPTAEEAYEKAQQWFDKFGKYHVACKYYSNPGFGKALYEISRKAYAQED